MGNECKKAVLEGIVGQLRGEVPVFITKDYSLCNTRSDYKTAGSMRILKIYPKFIGTPVLKNSRANGRLGDLKVRGIAPTRFITGSPVFGFNA